MRTWLRRTEIALFAAGSLCVLLFAVIQVRAGAARHSADAFGQKANDTSGRKVQLNEGDTTRPGEVIGKLEIPAIGLFVPVMSDYRSASLLKGVGYIPGTAKPGGLGTLGLAGHRDTYFRPLSRIAAKMDVRVSDRTGTYHYQVESTEIVDPEQVSVLDIRDIPELTLITCYPFHYVGVAPQRFIVHARLVSVAPD